MKNKLLSTLTTVTLCLLIFDSVGVWAKTINVSTISELQSPHPYSDITDKTWVYTHPSNAESLEITFSDDTETENNFDFIYIYDMNENQIGKYCGMELAGKTIQVSGNTVKIRLTSEGNMVKYGFRITNIVAKGNRKFTKTTVSQDGKTYSVSPFNIENGKTIILALYDGEKLVEMKKATYEGTQIIFPTTITHTNAKVMVWDNLSNITPVCETEIVK